MAWGKRNRDDAEATAQAQIFRLREELVAARERIATLEARLIITNAAIRQELPKFNDRPLVQAFLLGFIRVNEEVLAPKVKNEQYPLPG